MSEKFLNLSKGVKGLIVAIVWLITIISFTSCILLKHYIGENSYWIQVLLTLAGLLFSAIACIFILIPAYYQAYNVHQTKYLVYTKKDIGLDKLRIVQISDSHLGTTMNGKEFCKYLEELIS